MNRNQHRGSAEIIQFPSGGRRGLAPPNGQVARAIELPVEGTVRVAAGSGWYHEAAIEEAESHKH